MAVFEGPQKELEQIGGHLVLAIEASCIADRKRHGAANGRERILAAAPESGDARVALPDLTGLLPPSLQEIQQLPFEAVIPPGGKGSGRELLNVFGRIGGELEEVLLDDLGGELADQSQGLHQHLVELEGVFLRTVESPPGCLLPRRRRVQRRRDRHRPRGRRIEGLRHRNGDPDHLPQHRESGEQTPPLVLPAHLQDLLPAVLAGADDPRAARSGLHLLEIGGALGEVGIVELGDGGVRRAPDLVDEQLEAGEEHVVRQPVEQGEAEHQELLAGVELAVPLGDPRKISSEPRELSIDFLPG